VIRKAFMLGAGLGTRLRPLTHHLPKPLVPLFHKPLVEWGMEACAAAGVTEFAINTHHLPERWRMVGGGWRIGEETGLVGENGLASTVGRWKGLPVSLFHEPELLETGGGIRNIARWVGDDDVLVHNGDIFASLPLPELVAAHRASGNVVTLALRSEGVARHIAVEGQRVVDIRGKLGRAEGTHVFSGIYCFSPELLGRIPSGEKVSVIPAFLELAAEGRLGGVVLDRGEWFDLGDEASYLEAHRVLRLAEPVHPEAMVSPGALVERSVIGPRSTIAGGAVVRDSVLWPGAGVGPGEVVEGRVVTG